MPCFSIKMLWVLQCCNSPHQGFRTENNFQRGAPRLQCAGAGDWTRMFVCVSVYVRTVFCCTLPNNPSELGEYPKKEGNFLAVRMSFTVKSSLY